jgi:hypothetical protein
VEITIVRRFLAALSACVAALCVLVYAASLTGIRFDEVVWNGLVAGAIAVSAPLAFFEHRSLRARTYWRDSARAMPLWARATGKAFWLIAMAHFVWFFFSGYQGSPTIQPDGQFVINSHGRILKVLTESEYWTVKAAELRFLISLIMAVCISTMMAWWFPSAKSKAVAA